MGSIKGFIDWVKGSELEDDYEDEMPRQKTKNLRWIASHHLTIEDPMTVRNDSDAQDVPQVRRHDRSDKVVKHQYYYTVGCGSGQAGSL